MDAGKLKALLAKDEIEAVLQALEQPCAQRSDLQQDWISLSGRFHQLQSQDLRGVRDQDELGIQRNQLVEDLLLLIERCTTPPAPPLQRSKQWLQQFRWPLLILGISLLVIGIGTLPVRQVGFEATLLSSDFNFRLAEPWPESTNWSSTRLYLGPLQEVRGTGWQYHLDQVGQPIELLLDSGKMDIGPLYIPAQEALSLRSRQGEISLVLGEKASGDINVQQGQLQLEPSLGRRSYGAAANNGDLLSWTAEPGAQLTFYNPGQNWRWPRLSIQSAEFIRKEQEKLPSALCGGTLQVQGSDPVSIQAGDFLELGALLEADFSIQTRQDTLLIHLRGKTNSIQTGKQRLYSRKPSLLEYWYHDKKVYLLASLFVSLVGLLWTVRTALNQQ
jgi:hypothetical protein